LIIIGIDPGLRITGYGCIAIEPDVDEPVLIEGGIFRLDDDADIASRLLQLKQDLEEAIETHEPDLMIVEELFVHPRHVRTALLMSHARGVILLAARETGLRLEEMTATAVKRSMTGHGHATKRQVQEAVCRQLNLPSIPEPADISDALAIAICGARRFACAT